MGHTELIYFCERNAGHALNGESAGTPVVRCKLIQSATVESKHGLHKCVYIGGRSIVQAGAGGQCCTQSLFITVHRTEIECDSLNVCATNEKCSPCEIFRNAPYTRQYSYTHELLYF